MDDNGESLITLPYILVVIGLVSVLLILAMWILDAPNEHGGVSAGVNAHIFA